MILGSQRLHIASRVALGISGLYPTCHSSLDIFPHDTGIDGGGNGNMGVVRDLTEEGFSGGSFSSRILLNSLCQRRSLSCTFVIDSTLPSSTASCPSSRSTRRRRVVPGYEQDMFRFSHRPHRGPMPLHRWNRGDCRGCQSTSES